MIKDILEIKKQIIYMMQTEQFLHLMYYKLNKYMVGKLMQ